MFATARAWCISPNMAKWGRYFLANTEAIPLNEFASGTFARLAHRPLRVCAAAASSRSRSGRHLRENAVLSEHQLRGIGFRFKCRTLEQGCSRFLGAR
jgi:hypothetical protein